MTEIEKRMPKNVENMIKLRKQNGIGLSVKKGWLLMGKSTKK